MPLIPALRCKQMKDQTAAARKPPILQYTTGAVQIRGHIFLSATFCSTVGHSQRLKSFKKIWKNKTGVEFFWSKNRGTKHHKLYSLCLADFQRR